ncbi:hypothetical protein RND81_13G141800 [Saponaria officinalis]|uniref:Uncharacterized protein n=1 Tax=Saponaria officinalis TaxID=3572 RepID=A0AAW1H2F7_SAPOF
MGWLQSLFCPLKKLWSQFNLGHRKRKRGFHMLFEDVKSCECEDVQALWSILMDSQRVHTHTT